MRIKTRLKLNTWMALGAIALMVVSLAWSFWRSYQADRDEELAERMRRVAFDRTVLRDEYLLYREDRAIGQWRAKSQTLSELLQRAKVQFDGEEAKTLLAGAQMDFDVTFSLFSALAERHGWKGQAGGRAPAFDEAEARIISQVFLNAYSLKDNIGLLHELAEKRARRTRNLGFLLTFLCMAGGGLAIVINSLITNRTIDRGLARLRRGVEAIGGGNLDHRIEMQGSDELSALARLTNEMAANLKESHTSLENLQWEVAERKRAEERLRRMNRLYATLSQVNQTIVRTSEEKDLFPEICRVAVTYGEFRLAWVGLLNEETGDVVPIAAHGDVEYAGEIRINVRDEELRAGPTGRAIREERISFASHVGTDPGMGPWRDAAIRHGLHSSAAVPIRRAGRVIGSLNLYAAESAFFSADEIGLLEEVGSDLSYALDSMESQRKSLKADEALRESEERYRAIMEQAADAVFIHDETGKIMDVNRKACGSLGYSREELLAMSIRDIDPAAMQSAKDKLWSRVVAGEQFTFESRQIRKDGTEFPVEVALGSVRLPLGPAVLGIVRDVTERKLADERLTKQLAELRRWYEAMLGREMRILELKREVNELSALLGRAVRYSSAEQEGKNG